MIRESGSRAARRSLAVLPLALLLLSLLLAPAIAGASPAAAAHPAAAQKALDWMAEQQQPDGSFPGFGVGSTADAVYSLGAGNNAGLSTKGTAAAIDYLKANAQDYAKSAGAAAKLLLALVATGRTAEAASFGGVDLLGAINGQYDAAKGQYGSDVTGHAFSILALKSAGQTVPAAAGAWLAQAQAPSGGWAFDGSTAEGAADTNTTGLALQALAIAGGDWSAARTKALTYLKGQQNADAGFAYQKGPGNDSDANSTASVISGLIAASEDPEGAGWTVGGANPMQVLLGLQNASGAFRYQASTPDDNGGATYQAVTAVLAVPLPIVGTAAGVQPGMPRTGDGMLDLLALLALAGAGASLAGWTLRRGASKIA